MKLTARNTHRDLAYFYLGLIIAFSFSGIFLNHRQAWHPRRYTFDRKEIKVTLPTISDSINERFVKGLAEQFEFKDRFRRFSIEKNTLRGSFESHDLSVDLATGKGEIVTYKTTPILGQMTKLHVDTSAWWIYYSDAFGIAMLVIAFTGMFIQKGENSFWKRGWKLALIGIIFPLIFLFLLS